MIRAKRFFLSMAVLVFIFTAANILYSKKKGKVAVTKVFLTNNYIYIAIRSSFEQSVDIERIITEGIELKVNYHISVYKIMGGLLPDELVTKTTVYYKVQEDIINSGYELTEYSKDDEMGMWFSEVSELKYFLMNLDDVKVINRGKMEEDFNYYIELQLVVNSMKLYPPLSIIFNLFGKWNYTSPKIKSKVFNRDGIIKKQ